MHGKKSFSKGLNPLLPLSDVFWALKYKWYSKHVFQGEKSKKILTLKILKSYNNHAEVVTGKKRQKADYDVLFCNFS
ncbi:MAG: hypothetical protein MRJ65_10765 [Candidatus Brocadiaceae bacterium]|nr:hypothetical protein [Candidatus Brocadiaceae bacterium]